MRRALATTCTVLLLAGCGARSAAHSTTPSTARSSSVTSACVILENGNELCGQSAVAYCRRFETNPPDAKTAQACAAADPSHVYRAPLPPPSQSHGKVPCDEYPTKRQQAECMRSALAGTGISP